MIWLLFQTFFLLLVGHALADGPLQGAKLSGAKQVGSDPEFPWWIALPAHGGIHAAAVYFVTGSFVLTIAEWICHCVIDFPKGAAGLVLVAAQ